VARGQPHVDLAVGAERGEDVAHAVDAIGVLGAVHAARLVVGRPAANPPALYFA
jgi:hypothetical protein